MNVHGLEKGLNFDSETFQELRQSASFVLQRLLGNMVEKGVDEGKVTINIDVSFNKQNVPDFSPGAEKGNSREAIKPKFVHKITSNFQMKDEKKGNIDTEMEMVLDDDTGEFVMRPIVDTEQRSMFDSDYQDVFGASDDVACVNDDIPGTELQGDEQPALPGPTEESGGDGQADDGQGAEPEDISDELLGDAGTEDGLPFSDDGYSYEEPEDDGDDKE